MPCTKIKKAKKHSILVDHLGTPTQMYDEEGLSTWYVELDSFGNLKLNKGDSKTECPFRYQGQYEDVETGLYYNRFRYYDPKDGGYISQDPIGLAGGNPTLYGYVHDISLWIDPFG
ncbi:RHS repeat domain-containing protein, partial [Myroides albus]|uniref:RHS repeat domain-containing protein n=1 Tax=Myroides albus TaxID=2562892 RepID=UPI0029392E49